MIKCLELNIWFRCILWLPSVAWVALNSVSVESVAHNACTNVHVRTLI